MAEALNRAARELTCHAPRISTVKINPEYIGMVIGKGGETIRSLEVRLRGADRHRGGRHDPDLAPTEGDKAEAAIHAIRG